MELAGWGGVACFGVLLSGSGQNSDGQVSNQITQVSYQIAQVKKKRVQVRKIDLQVKKKMPPTYTLQAYTFDSHKNPISLQPHHLKTLHPKPFYDINPNI